MVVSDALGCSMPFAVANVLTFAFVYGVRLLFGVRVYG